MKERSQSSDGSQYYGNGVWGPSAADQKRANLSLPRIKPEPKKEEKGNNDPWLWPSQTWLSQIASKIKLPRKFVVPGSISAMLIASGCLGDNGNNAKELENEQSGYSLPFPEGETWYLTTGPHGDGYSNGIKYAIDIAPPEGGFCPSDGRRFTIDNRVVTASESGKVTAKGDDKNRNDPYHSEIRIEDKNGLTLTYVHLDNTKVKLGATVKRGDPLGNPSCEFPPGGSNSGPHVHIGLMKDGKAIPIDGAAVGGWTIHEGKNGQEGTMTKDGEVTRTADAGRHGENSTVIRNDLPNTSNKAVIAGPKDPISPISGKATSKEVFTAKPPPPSPTETPQLTSAIEKPVEQGWKQFRSPMQLFQINYPSGWTQAGQEIDPKYAWDMFDKYEDFSDDEGHPIFTVFSGPLPAGSNLDSLKEMAFTQNYKNSAHISLVETGNQIVDGEKAWRVDMVIDDTNADKRQTYYITIKGQRVWLIGIRADWNASFEKNFSIAQTMLSSFRFPTTTEVQKPTSTVEKPMDQGWVRFRSVSYPYQIDYPSGWTAGNTQWGQAIDIFKGEIVDNFQTNVNIFSEPVNSWVTSEDYANNLVAKYKQAGIQANIKDVDGKTGNPIRVAGQGTYFIVASMPAGTVLFVNQDTVSTSAVFVKDGKGWQITLTLATHPDYDYFKSIFESTFNNFQKMLASFKFLQ